MMKPLRLYKSEKLCSRTAVERLFVSGHSVMAYPLRAMAVVRDRGARRGEAARAQFMITVPKKRIRHAVQRVLLRRRVREAYRLLRNTLLLPALESADVCIDVAFVYIANDVADYATIERKMKRLLTRLAESAKSAQQPETTEGGDHDEVPESEVTNP